MRWAGPALAEELALVTGSGGFLAPAVCSELRGRGYRLRGYARNGIAPPGVESAAGDIRDRAALRRALEGVTTVVHLAARVHQRKIRGQSSERELTEYRAVNVEGTRALLEESVRAGVQRFLHFSSVKAVTESSARPIDEAEPPAPRDAYGVSKLESEVVVRDIAGSSAIRASILRLPLVYGPGVKANMLHLFRAVDRGVPLPFGKVRNNRSLVFTGNVAAAAGAVLSAPAAAGETFFVSDGHDVSTPELLAAVGVALGKNARLLDIPVPALQIAGLLGDALGLMIPSPIGSDLVARLTGSLTLDISRIRRIVDYEPPFTLAQGLSATAEWYMRERM